MKEKGIDMVVGSPRKVLIQFAIPIILGNLFQQFYNMADSIVVGKFVGKNALAAVGASYAITNIFIAIAVGGGIGSSIIISQYLGAQNYCNMKKGILTALVNFVLIGLALSILGNIFCKPLLVVLNTPNNILSDAVVYLKIYFGGMTFLFLYNIVSNIFNSLGDSRTPLNLLIFSSTFNVILDIIFVAVFHWNVAGVAAATVIAQGVSSILALVILFKKVQKNYPPHTHVSYSFDITERMLTVAIPSIIQQSIVNIGMLLVQSVVNGYGSAVLAGYSASMRFESICVIPMVGVGNAISTYTAQNMGAGKTERVNKGYHAGYIIIITVAIIICLILLLFGDKLLMAFLNTGSKSKAFDTGLSYLHFMAFFFIIMGMKSITDGVLRGAGDVIAFTFANLVNLTIRVSFAHIFAPIIGVQAVWIATPVGWTANFLISFAWYLTGKWKLKKVI